MSQPSKSKDCWDKTEVVGSLIGKILIPGLVAYLVWDWNMQKTARQTAATMTQIAVGVLSVPPEHGDTDALREWAISVLQNPSNPPELTDEAAERLRFEPFLQIYRGTLTDILNRPID